MCGFKPDSTNHDGDRVQADLLAATESDRDTRTAADGAGSHPGHADAHAGNRKPASYAARLDHLHGNHAELGYRPAAGSGPRRDIAHTWKSAGTNRHGPTGGGGRCGNRHIDDYYCHACPQAVGAYAAAAASPFARFAL